MKRDDLERLLVEHTDAWNSHDVERLMDLFSDDCIFDASMGTESVGQRFSGRGAVRSAFVDVLESMPDAHWGEGQHTVLSETYGISEWRLTGTRLDGTVLDVNGCDFVTVRDDKIIRKNAFRKQRLG